MQRVMGDRDRDRPIHNGSTTSLLAGNALLEEERSLLGEGLAHGELRDEIYCQVMKQLNGNPNPCVYSVSYAVHFMTVDLITLERVFSKDGSFSASSSSRSRPPKTSKHRCETSSRGPLINQKAVWISWQNIACAGYPTFLGRDLGGRPQLFPRLSLHLYVPKTALGDACPDCNRGSRMPHFIRLSLGNRSTRFSGCRNVIIPSKRSRSSYPSFPTASWLWVGLNLRVSSGYQETGTPSLNSNSASIRVIIP